ncbi:MAG: DinB family protein [Ignavibacteriae bacterium]|nr:MAG: DinB family protein [Ignavibacteriota bacterium]
MNNIESSTVFKYTGYLINKSLHDIDHEESIIEPELGGNSINWILGHLVVSKDDVLKDLGLESLGNKEYEKNYERGTKPDPKCAIKLEEILKLFNEGHEKVMKALEENPVTDEEKRQNIIFLAFHEAYHCGQIGLLRRVLGKESIVK